MRNELLFSACLPEAIACQKPIYLRSQGLDKGCHKRVGGHDMPCTEADLARFFQDRALISPDMLPVPLAQRAQRAQRAELDAGQIRVFSPTGGDAEPRQRRPGPRRR